MEKENLIKEIKEIIEIVKICPQNLQEKCFEILLSNLIKECDKSKEKKGLTPLQPQEQVGTNINVVEQGNGEVQEEIKLTDLHLKAKKLLDQGITLEEINNVFYKENGELKPLFDDLKSSTMAESQIKLALLEAFKNAIITGDFKFDTNIVKQQCDTYKCFDGANFAKNFKGKKNLFNEDYSRDSTMSLTTAGKKELINTIKQLA